MAPHDLNTDIDAKRCNGEVCSYVEAALHWTRLRCSPHNLILSSDGSNAKSLRDKAHTGASPQRDASSQICNLFSSLLHWMFGSRYHFTCTLQEDSRRSSRHCAAVSLIPVHGFELFTSCLSQFTMLAKRINTANDTKISTKTFGLSHAVCFWLNLERVLLVQPLRRDRGLAPNSVFSGSPRDVMERRRGAATAPTLRSRFSGD